MEAKNTQNKLPDKLTKCATFGWFSHFWAFLGQWWAIGCSRSVQFECYINRQQEITATCKARLIDTFIQQQQEEEQRQEQ